MGHLFEIILPFLALGKRDKDQAKIDNFTFQLHYRFTSAVLFMATVLLAANNFFGKEIQCFDNAKGKADKAITQYCFVSGTFTVPEREDGRMLEDPGCCQPDLPKWEGRGSELFLESKNQECSTEEKKGRRCKTVHSYYQWVAYILVFQGVLFLLPHQLWSILEGGRVNAMVNGINNITDEDNAVVNKKRNQVIRNIARFIHSQQAKANENGHIRSGAILRKYTFSYLLCHALNLINVIVNINLLNTFFDGRFTEFGTRWLASSETHSVLPDVFPTMTGCTWQQFGSGGHPEEITYLCILATNVATEKVFIFLWFWYLLLVPISFCSFLYYSALFLSRDEDWRIFSLKITRSKDECNELVGSDECSWVDYIKEMSSGQFFLLYLLAQNIEPCIMHKLVKGMAEAKNSPPDYRSSIMNISRPPSYLQASASQLSLQHQHTWHGSTNSQQNRASAVSLLRETSYCGAFPTRRPTLQHSPSAPALPSTKEETTFSLGAD